jgi:hypothetical protein
MTIEASGSALPCRAVLGIDEIVSASLHVIVCGVAARQGNRDVVDSVGIHLVPQREQQVAQRGASARDERDRHVLAPRPSQSRNGAAAHRSAQHAGPCQSRKFRAVEVAGARHVRCDAVIELEAGATRHRFPQAFRLGRIRDPRRVAALDSRPAPPADVDQLFEPGVLEQPNCRLAPGAEPHLREARLARLRDRRGEHGSRDAASPVSACDPQTLVPHQPGRKGSEPLQADHHAIDLRGLKSRSRVGHPAIENLR